MESDVFKSHFLDMMNNQDNPFHPLVWVNGNPEVGEHVYVGGFSEINAKGAKVSIGAHCDIASFVAINCADSHLMTIGLAEDNVCKDITLEERVFVGSHCAILGGSYIGRQSVIAAGSIVRGETIPPYSLAYGNPLVVKSGYYAKRLGVDV